MNTALLTPDEAADFLQVKVGWLYRHTEVPRVKVGHLLRFRQKDLEDFTEAHVVRRGSGRTARSGNRHHRY